MVKHHKYMYCITEKVICDMDSFDIVQANIKYYMRTIRVKERSNYKAPFMSCLCLE